MLLRPWERRLLVAVADALIPPGDGPPSGAVAAGTPEAVAALLEGRLGAPAAWGVRTALWLLAVLAMVRHRRPLGRLDRAARVALLGSLGRRWWGVGLLAALKHVVVNTHLERVGVELGYRRPDPLDPRPHAPGPRLTPISYPDLPPALHADAVVVGSGAGGAVVAAVLAEAGLDVVVVEEGRYHTREDFDRGVWQRFVDLYRDQGATIALGRPPIPVPVGRAVGGTTVVNAGTSLRPPEEVVAGWARRGLVGLAEALPTLLDEVEAVQHVRPVPEAVMGVNGATFAAAADRLGLHGAPLRRNIRGCRGSGECVVGCPTDAKLAVHLTWLPRAEAAGARILAGVRVDRVVVESGRAVGVVGTVLDRQDRRRGRIRITADTVVVAAGALHTPVLLHRSGVPDPSGQRGRHLMLHPAVGLAAELPDEVRAWRGTLQSWGVELGDGIVVEATTAPPPLTGANVPGVGEELREVLAATPHLISSGFLITDSTSGWVRPGVGGRPLIRYQLTGHDLRRIRRGLGVLTEVFAQAGARRILVGLPGRPWLDPAAALRVFRDGPLPATALKVSAYHPVGTHRLSADPGGGPCDPDGRVRGVAGLWVADASLLPGCLGVNPQLTIMAVALYVARRIVTERGADRSRAA